MIFRLTIALAIIILSRGASAQDNIDRLCRDLSQYTPIEGVAFDPSAADVPADILRVQDPLTGAISVPVEIDLAAYFDRPDLKTIPGLDFAPEVSHILINQDGSVYYNEQEITPILQRFCANPVPENVPPEVPKKSSVSVTSGDAVVIGDKPAPKPTSKPLRKQGIEVEVLEDEPLEIEPIKDVVPEAQNPVDDATSQAQNKDIETSDDTLIEGQYP